jgi:hypothetical protein
MSALEEVVDLYAKHGFLAVAGAAAVLISVKVVPDIYKYFKNKKEKELELDSVHVVFGVDKNRDVWLYSVFKTDSEAQDYSSQISKIVDKSISILSNQFYFKKPIKGLEGYNPYSQNHAFGKSRRKEKSEDLGFDCISFEKEVDLEAEELKSLLKRFEEQNSSTPVRDCAAPIEHEETNPNENTIRKTSQESLLKIREWMETQK